MPFNLLDLIGPLFPGIWTFFLVQPYQALARVVLIIIGGLFVFLAYRKIVEPLIILPMGLGILFSNMSMLVLPNGAIGTLHVNPMVSSPSDVIQALQIFWLQPVYTLAFLNTLIVCMIFLGIGLITDLSFLISKPLMSLFLASFAELGTVFTLPLGVMAGLSLKEAAAVSIVGGADGPVVLLTSLFLAPELFVPIGIIAYIYLSVLYILQPYINKAIIPKSAMGTYMDPMKVGKADQREKMVFAVLVGSLLCLMFPSAAPLFASFFLGVVIKEARIDRYSKFLDEVVLSGSTFFLAFVLGMLTTSDVVTNPKVFLILVLGITSLILSCIGGAIGGMVLYYISGKKINPLLGPAGVSCVPTTAKISQEMAQEINPKNYIILYAMGPNVAGVITTAVICSLYITLIPLM
jgi:oxaloacetate decarboxylase beta subunit